MLLKIKDSDIPMEPAQVQGTLEFEIGVSSETFCFNLPLFLNRTWMLGLASLEVHNSLFKLTEINNFIVEKKSFRETSEIFDKIGAKLDRKVY